MKLMPTSVFFLESAVTVFGIGVVLFSFAAISTKPEYAQSFLFRSGEPRTARIDFEGWILLVLAVTIPLIAVTLGDNFLPWAHPVEILLLILGPLFICLFVLYESKVAAIAIIDMRPIFDVRYLRVLLQVLGVIMIINCVRSYLT